jgi:protein-S-isoprenylcysteine O-methyltransferase Ste14
VQIAPQPRDGGHLVATGVYARFRHPMYTGIVLLVIGLWLRKPTLAIGIATLLVVAVLTVKGAYEERLLAARYPGYLQYKRRTFGVIPICT